MKLVKLLTALFLVLSLILPSSVMAAGSTTASLQESSVDLLGKLNSKNNRLYQDYKKPTAYSLVGTANLNKIFYIKKQATYKGVVYYLLSTKPSATSGVIGWTKAAAITIQQPAKAEAVAKEVAVDLLAQFNTKNNRIYSDYKKPSAYKLAGTANLNKTFYIKKQATYNDAVYYLISTQPSATSGVVGWTKAAAVTIQQPAKAEAEVKEAAVDLVAKFNSQNNRIYPDYKKPKVYNLAGASNLNKTFYIKKQVTYNGVVYYLVSTQPSATSGVIGWTKAAAVTTQVPTKLESAESSVSLLGHMKGVNNRIYPDYKKPKAYKLAGTDNTNEVFYIKKQAKYNGAVYYLISRSPSSTTGVVGWTKAEAINTQTHVTIDKNPKTFYAIGTGSAYTKPWGGTKNYYFKSLVVSTGREFKVNMTEKVGNTVWYQGILNEKSVWIEAQYVTSAKPSTPSTPPPAVKDESPVSLVGKIEVPASRIYADYTKQTAYTEAGAANTDDVFYIKKQANFNKEVYYQLSRNASGTTELAGWVKSTDIKTETHTAVDKNAKVFYVLGAGSAYSKVWGGSKNLAIKDLSALKGKVFSVYTTEKIGTVLWHQGTIDGKTVWIDAQQLAASYESDTSLLGRISSASIRIYPDYQKQTSYTEAGTANTDKVFYIKKQASFNNELYYQLSQSASGTNVAGWVRSSDIATATHTLVDNNSNTFYVKGTGSAYTDIWGGTKNLSIQDMTSLKGSVFQVKATEKAGNTTWHQGIVSGKTVWMEAAHLEQSLESPASLVGHVNGTSVRIYPDYLKQSTYITAGTANTNEVFYIKKQAAYNNATYYLISRNRSATTGLVGWVKSTDIKTAAHTPVDNIAKTYNIKGTGTAYLKIAGGTKNIVFQDLSALKGAAFPINLTEKIDNQVWHRGVLSGKTVWIQEADLIKVDTIYTQYNYTFDEALARQMKVLQQTDKYANSKAYIASSSVKVVDATPTITTDGTRLRKSPDLLASSISYTINKGTKITIQGTVTGASSGGSTLWYKITYAGETLYVHSSLVNTGTATGTLSVKTNVMNAESATSHVYGTLAAGATVTIKNKGTNWHEISYGAWRNPTQSDVATYLDPNNNDKFQHLLLTSSAGVSAAELNKILVGKGILAGLGQSFINGGKQYRVNEVYLISHALLETGQGTSQLATGVEVGKNATGTPVLVTTANRSSLTAIKKTYNMFGIGAVDGNALAAGAIRAYNSGWFTPEAAIIGGAQFVGTNYLDKGQDTLYKMRWNPANPATHQYASDIGWAAKQTVRMNSLYNMLDSYTLTLDIPKYK